MIASAPKAWLVHGFNVRDEGAGTIDRVGPYLDASGWVVSQYDYGWTLLLGVLFGNPGRARELSRDSEPGDIAIGHSNGCAIIHRALHAGAHFDQVVYINPALDTTAMLPPADSTRLRKLHVFHAHDDRAVHLARWIPGSLWGGMGRDGYEGPADPRIQNRPLHRIIAPPIGHSGALHRADQFGPYLAYIVGAPQ